MKKLFRNAHPEAMAVMVIIVFGSAIGTFGITGVLALVAKIFNM